MPKILARQVRSRGLLPDWDLVIKEVEATLDSHVKPLFVNYFVRIVEPWDEEDRPAFRARKNITKKEISIYVFPVGPNAWLWKLVSVTGSGPHPIEARNAPFLVFMWGGYGSYLARTDTSGHYRGPGEIEGGSVRKTVAVEHPGFPPRNFEKFIILWGKKKALRLIENAFRRGIRRAKASSKQL